MNEQDLQDRMAGSAAWTELTSSDVTGDIERGRSRLRRRRVGVGLTAMSAVAVAALGVNAVAGQFGNDVGAAGTPPLAVNTPTPNASITAKFVEPRKRAAIHAAAVVKHIDPQKEYTSDIRLGSGQTDSTATGQVWTAWYSHGSWEQDGGSGMLSIHVAKEKETNLHCGPEAESPSILKFSCQWKTLPDGTKVQVGQATSSGVYKGVTYKNIPSRFAYYVRPDGQSTFVAVFGGAGNTSERQLLKRPLSKLDVTEEQLIAAVKDPALSGR
ncbi:hypothetical protein [Kribbella deserti]|uniref:Uncharacterized protein n=1 Tax=Kribbella deserti TaxID=1926257 RepID=A0ABV6QY53_9ACTN